MRLGQNGYTIVELLLVMGVSAMMLATAIAAFGGQQNRTQFSEGVRDLQTRLQLVLSEVATNTYPNAGGFSCTATATGVSVSAGSADDAGRNTGCVKLGSILYFYKESDTTSGMIRTSVVGRRFSGLASETPAITFNESLPSFFHSNPRDDYIFRSGIILDRIMDGASTNRSPILGIVSSLNGIGTISASQPSQTGGYNAQAGSFNSGTQAMSVSPLGTSSTTIGARDNADTRLSTAVSESMRSNQSQLAPMPTGQYVLCVSNRPLGGLPFGRQFATIIVSGTGSATQVNTEINGGVCS